MTILDIYFYPLYFATGLSLWLALSCFNFVFRVSSVSNAKEADDLENLYRMGLASSICFLFTLFAVLGGSFYTQAAGWNYGIYWFFYDMLAVCILLKINNRTLFPILLAFSFILYCPFQITWQSWIEFETYTTNNWYTYKVNIFMVTCVQSLILFWGTFYGRKIIKSSTITINTAYNLVDVFNCLGGGRVFVRSKLHNVLESKKVSSKNKEILS